MSLDPRLNQHGKNIDIEMMDRMDESLFQIVVLALAGIVYWGMYFFSDTMIEDAWMYGGGIIICLSVFIYFKWKKEKVYFKEGLFICTLLCMLYLAIMNILFGNVVNWFIAMIGMLINGFLIVSLPYTIMYEIVWLMEKNVN